MISWRPCLLFCVGLLPLCAAARAQEAQWKQLNAQVLALEKDGKYDDALKTAMDALKVAVATFDEGDPRLAIALANVAQVYFDASDFKDAEPLYTRALGMMEKDEGLESPLVAPLLGGLANVLSEEDKLGDAEPLYRRMLSIDEKAMGADNPGLANDLNDLGSLVYREGHDAEAATLFAKAMKLDEQAHGAESVEVSTDASNLGLALDYEGKFAEAEPLFARALAIDEKLSGPNHPSVGNDLVNLGVVYVDEGRFAEAVPLYQRALGNLEGLGPNHADLATAENKLGLVYVRLARYADAEPLFERARAIDEKVFGAESSDVAGDLVNRATLDEDRGRFAEAEANFKQALAIDEKVLGPDHPDVASIVEDLGQLYAKEHKYEDAESYDQRGVKMAAKSKGEDHPEYGSALDGLASLYNEMGRYAEAESLFAKALAIETKAEGEDHADVATTVESLGSLYFHTGKYALAETSFERALQIKEKVFGPEHPEVATCLENLGTLEATQGKNTEAEGIFERALAIDDKALGADSAEVATELNDLAMVYLREEKPADATKLLERALAIDEKTLGPDDTSVAATLSNQAAVQIETGKYAEAEPLVARALAIDEKALGAENPEVAEVLNSQAVLYAKEGRYAEAEPLYERIVAIHGKVLGPDHPLLAIDLTNFGLLYEYQNKYAQAAPLFERALNNLFEQFAYNSTYMTEQDRLTFLNTVESDFPAYFSFVHRFHEQDQELAGSMYNLLLWEKGAIAGSEADMRRQIEASGDAEALELLNQLAEKRTQIATLENVQPADRDLWRKQMDALAADADQIEKALVARSAAFAERRKLERATWQQVRDALKPGEAAVEIARFQFYDAHWTGKSYYVALVVRHETSDEPAYVFLGDDTQIEGAAIKRFQSQVRTRGIAAEPEAALPGADAYALIWKPLEAALSGVTRIYFSADGILNELPLGIIAGPDGKLEMEKYDLRLLSSTRDLLRAPPAEGAKTSAETALLVGNPAFALGADAERAALEKLAMPGAAGQGAAASAPESDGAREVSGEGSSGVSRDLPQDASRGGGTGGALPPLPGTGAEVDAIAALMQKQSWKTEVFTGDLALKTVVERARGARVVHLATHGFFLPDQQAKASDFLSAERSDPQTSGLEDPMLRSGLYFAGADRTVEGKATAQDLDNGVLTAMEAGNLDLHGTALVVLSACNTGQGEVKDGEGVFGLRRALEEAGAQEVLMSLWSVPDQETLELMQRFYANWLSGMEVHESLKKAQLELRAQVKAEHDGRDLPFYWGAFVLVGR
jgi:tetratricopeptide (TPR) repeat protein